MQIVIIDLASLQSVRDAAKKMLELGSPDVLINNAALVSSGFPPPPLQPSD